MNKKKLSWFERYLFDEIGIEFKACLYFFAIMFFYFIVIIILIGHLAVALLDIVN